MEPHPCIDSGVLLCVDVNTVGYDLLPLPHFDGDYLGGDGFDVMMNCIKLIDMHCGDSIAMKVQPSTVGKLNSDVCLVCIVFHLNDTFDVWLCVNVLIVD